MVLLPDDWVLPEGASFKAEMKWSSNSYSEEQWNVMQKGGAIFLPASGARFSDPTDDGGWEVYMQNMGITGHYWTTTQANNGNSACDFGFYSGGVRATIDEYIYSFYGCHVRLVQDVK